ncbi:hypothetical protein AX16_002526 [Volvariella volvacea WC 439]|nr:hypothetical protein AX16_002526 [Volvariella volvacea WC 439]
MPIPNVEAQVAEIDAHIAEIDAEILSLELKRAGLLWHRNALIPLNKLLPELISKVLQHILRLLSRGVVYVDYSNSVLYILEEHSIGAFATMGLDRQTCSPCLVAGWVKKGILWHQNIPTPHLEILSYLGAVPHSVRSLSSPISANTMPKLRKLRLERIRRAD